MTLPDPNAPAPTDAPQPPAAPASQPESPPTEAAAPSENPAAPAAPPTEEREPILAAPKPATPPPPEDRADVTARSAANLSDEAKEILADAGNELVRLVEVQGERLTAQGKALIKRTAAIAAIATATGDEASLASLTRQVNLTPELARLRANSVRWRAFKVGFSAITRLVGKALVATL